MKLSKLFEAVLIAQGFQKFVPVTENIDEEELRKQGYEPFQKTAPAWCRVATEEDKKKRPTIPTKEGDMEYEVGDYLCVGVEGEEWSIKKSIFEKTYKEVE